MQNLRKRTQPQQWIMPNLRGFPLQRILSVLMGGRPAASVWLWVRDSWLVFGVNLQHHVMMRLPPILINRNVKSTIIEGRRPSIIVCHRRQHRIPMNWWWLLHAKNENQEDIRIISYINSSSINRIKLTSTSQICFLVYVYFSPLFWFCFGFFCFGFQLKFYNINLRWNECNVKKEKRKPAKKLHCLWKLANGMM